MRDEVVRDAPLWPYTTLRVGGPAERLAVVSSADALIELALDAEFRGEQRTVLGWGSNVLPSDAGVPGLVLVNRSRRVRWTTSGEAEADCGVGFQDFFLSAAQRGWTGLEFAVGIPGTLGGALVSNAGAYRSAVSERLTAVQVVANGRVEWVTPSWLEFSYRDSRLRRAPGEGVVLVRARFQFQRREARAIYDDAREFQRQRIGKQPPQASAGSFFKNVESRDLAERLPTLPEGLRRAGVVPAGFLVEACGLSGCREGGAMVSRRHANFLINAGGARASEFAALAERVRSAVAARFAVILEAEVLYLGNWGSGSDVGRGTGSN